MWDILALNAEARAKLREMEHLADGWVVRWPGDREAFAIVALYCPWPTDLVIQLHDEGRIEGQDTGALGGYRTVLAATRHSASSTWGGSTDVGFLQLADDIWRERERVPTQDVDALMSLAR